MRKYDWKKLEKEYILSDYKSVSAFLKDKGISNSSGSSKKATRGWKERKAQNEHQKGTKTIEKIIEKEAEREAQQIVDVKMIANDLALKIIKAMSEIDTHLVTNKTKTKTVQYDYRIQKPNKEIIEEKEEIKSYIDIIDRKGLKELTSALKDINDILNNNKNNNNDAESLADAIQKAYEQKIGEE